MVLAGLLAVSLYVATLIRYTGRLEDERNTAQSEAARAEEVQQFLVDLFASANPFVPADTERGRRITVVEALDLGVERLGTSLKERPEARVSILSAIAGVYEDLGVYDRALPLRQEALELQRSLFGQTSRPVRDSLGSLAAIEAGLGVLERATELYQRRLELALAVEPPDIAEIADARTRLGRHYFSISRSEAAEEQLLAAIALAASGDVPALIEVEATRSLADTQRLRAKFEESERSALRAVELANAYFGAASTPSALARATLATTYSGMGRREEADRIFRIAIDDLERTLGSDHLFRLTTMTNYAILKSTHGELVESEKLLAEIIAIGERVYGADHPAVADYLQNYAGILRQVGQVDEAIETYERAAQIYRDKVSEDFKRALPLVSLADIYLQRHQSAKAEAATREAIPILEQSLPEGHFVTAVAYCRLARALVQQDRLAEAEPQFARSLDPILAATIYPDYRRTCLAAAAGYYRLRGE
ncbi:MAG: tetratricopeptide repeat protein, partial [Acidobacteriota bacterium]